MGFIQITTQEQIENNIRQIMKKELESTLIYIKQMIPTIEMRLRKDIFNDFKLITGIIIEQEFSKVYGQGFNLKSLQDSLIYIPSSSSLDIDLSYNSSVFRFNDKAYNDKNKFNQNARRWERKNRKYFNPGFYTDSGSFADFYEASDFDEYYDDSTDEDDSYEEILMDYDDVTFNNKRNPYLERSIPGTYKTAIKKAKYEFDLQWKSSLKGKYERKYGIKLT